MHIYIYIHIHIYICVFHNTRVPIRSVYEAYIRSGFLPSAKGYILHRMARDLDIST